MENGARERGGVMVSTAGTPKVLRWRYRADGAGDPDWEISWRSARRIGLQVAAVCAALVLAGAVVVFAYLAYKAVFDPDMESIEAHHVAISFAPLDVTIGIALLGLSAVILAGLAAVFIARRAVEPLTESLRRQRAFVADASHELRTPLTVLNLRAQQLVTMIPAAEPDSERSSVATGEESGGMAAREGGELSGREYQDAALRSVALDLLDDTKILIDIVNDLLETAADVQADLVPASVEEAMDAVYHDMELLAERRDVTLTMSPVSARVVLPDVPFRRCLVALIDNAVAHTPRGGAVQVAAELTGSSVTIRVRDEGEGIVGIDPAHVFDRFARGAGGESDAADGAVPQSHGIGLALVHDIAGRYGGSVVVEKTGPAGTIFALRVPRA